MTAEATSERTTNRPRPILVDIAVNTIKRNSEMIKQLRIEKEDLKGRVYHNEINRHKSASLRLKIYNLIDLNETLRNYVTMRLGTNFWNLENETN